MNSQFSIGLPENNGPSGPANQRGSSHMNIFGGMEPVVPTPKKNVPSSKIGNILMEDETDAKKGTKEEKELQKENETENGDVKPAAPTRVRMPPGGFSSGLW